MAISEDTSNQPVPVHAVTTTGTTASFTPASGTLLVAMLAVNGTGLAAVSAVVTDSALGTWTLLKRQNAINNPALGGSAEVWCRYLSSAPGSMTVTGAWTAGQSAGNLTVRSLLGADPVQPGVTGGTGAASVAPTVTMVPTVLGSWVYGAILDYATNASLTANASTTRIDQFQDATNGDTWAVFKGAAATASLASTAYGFTNANSSYNTAAAEILPLAGAVVLPSAPLVAGQAVGRASTW